MANGFGIPKGVSPEQGSRDAETARVEMLEKAQELDEELSGVPPKIDYPDELEELARERKKEEVCIKRARKYGDERPEEVLRQEFAELQRKMEEYQEKRKEEGDWTNPWDMTVDFMKESDSYFAAYLQKRQEENEKVPPWNVYLDYLDGRDLE
ncbi:MAG: hypothetical protein FJ044_05100 [Candidatus Cloacimonetes bacterium]|nr:hypothetical protein [Candidatus Cloacimonadota bacterium]